VTESTVVVVPETVRLPEIVAFVETVNAPVTPSPVDDTVALVAPPTCSSKSPVPASLITLFEELWNISRSFPVPQRVFTLSLKSIPEAPPIVTDAQVKTPLPFVCKYCEALPSAAGRVHTLLVLTVDGLAKPT